MVFEIKVVKLGPVQRFAEGKFRRVKESIGENDNRLCLPYLLVWMTKNRVPNVGNVKTKSCKSEWDTSPQENTKIILFGFFWGEISIFSLREIGDGDTGPPRKKRYVNNTDARFLDLGSRGLARRWHTSVRGDRRCGRGALRCCQVNPRGRRWLGSGRGGGMVTGDCSNVGVILPKSAKKGLDINA